MRSLPLALFLSAFALAQEPTPPEKKAPPDTKALIATAVDQLVAIQEEGGAWPYEGVYRVRGEIPVGYRIGGTSLVSMTLLNAAPEDAAAKAAIERGIGFVLANLGHPLMEPSQKEAYDVRVWGHACALELFAQLKAAKRMGERSGEIEGWIEKLVAALVFEEIPAGGWNYATRRQPAAFVTGPVVQALLWAKSVGYEVPDAVLARARQSLEMMRSKDGTFAYSGPASPREKLPGSVARSAVAETTIQLLGGGSVDRVKAAVDAFHTHWDQLEVRRKKTGTHVAPYGVAPYYFYFGHRYAAQAIKLLPEEVRTRERARMLEVLLRTIDPDGTWNDRVFPRSRNFGTAMALLALIGEKAPLPPAYTPKEDPSLPAGAPREQ